MVNAHDDSPFEAARPLTVAIPDAALTESYQGEEDEWIPEEKKLSWQHVAFFTFVATSAGPFGIEDAMQNGGPAIALFLVTFIPLCFMAPMCMMIQELAEWMPTNHGTIRWVRRAFGKRIGFVNAIVQVAVNIIDLGAYPVLVSDYMFGHFNPHASFGAKYAVRFAVAIGCGSLGFFNISSIATLSTVITVCIVIPFIVGSGMAAPEAVKHTDLWWQTVPDLQFASLFSIGMWMYSGFLSNSSLSGEVKKGALLKGQLVALGIDWMLYVIPICAVMHVQPDWAKWNSGYLGTAFSRINPALGTVIAFAGAASGIGLYISSLTCYCRTMWGVADLGWLPAVFRRKNRFNVPWVTLTLQLATTAFLCLFSFDFLVTVEFCFATFMYLLFVAAFLRLRWTEPDAPRGYRVPGNNVAAVLLSLPLAVFVGGAFGSTIVDWRIASAFVGFLGLLGLIYFFVVRPAEKTVTRVASFHDVLSSDGSPTGRASRAYLDA